MVPWRPGDGRAGVVTALWSTAAGLVRVGWMVLRARGGAGGAYWTWRRETAFGAGDTVPRARMLKATGEYCRWVSLMRSIQKGRPGHG